MLASAPLLSNLTRARFLALRRKISRRGSRFSLFYRRTRSIKIANLRKSVASQSILMAKFLPRGYRRLYFGLYFRLGFLPYLSMALMSASRARCFVISKIAKSTNLIKFAKSQRAQGAAKRRGVSNLALFNPQTSGQYPKPPAPFACTPQIFAQIPRAFAPRF